MKVLDKDKNVVLNEIIGASALFILMIVMTILILCF